MPTTKTQSLSRRTPSLLGWGSPRSGAREEGGGQGRQTPLRPGPRSLGSHPLSRPRARLHRSPRLSPRTRARSSWTTTCSWREILTWIGSSSRGTGEFLYFRGSLDDDDRRGVSGEGVRSYVCASARDPMANRDLGHCRVLRSSAGRAPLALPSFWFSKPKGGASLCRPTRGSSSPVPGVRVLRARWRG